MGIAKCGDSEVNFFVYEAGRAGGGTNEPIPHGFRSDDGININEKPNKSFFGAPILTMQNPLLQNCYRIAVYGPQLSYCD